MSIARSALFTLGFRPFYLLAAAFAAISVPVWLLEYSGTIPQGGYLSGLIWHSHEMLFGFAIAVMTGFLLTAVRNWTNLPTPAGATLMLLAALWFAARILVATGPGGLAAIVDAAFLPAVALGIGVPLVRSRNRRNYFFIGLLLLLAAVNASFHLGTLGVIAGHGTLMLRAGLYVVVVIVSVMGGRVIPSFTANAMPGVRIVRPAWLERAAIAVLVLAFVALLAWPVSTQGAVLCAGAAALHLWRQALWAPLATRGKPILWILHLSYLWIPAGLLLYAAAAMTAAVPASAALHALSLGAVGGMIIGMITRTARGHTGRPLQASAPEVAAYALVHLAALTRVLGAILLPQRHFESLVASAALWSAAFAIYCVVYFPILTRPRADSRPE